MEASMQYYCATSASLWMAFDYSNQNGTRRRGLTLHCTEGSPRALVSHRRLT